MTKKEEKILTDGEKLRGYMNSIPFGDYNKVFNQMVSACMIPKHTFKNWMNGVCRIPALAKREIEIVAGKHIF